MGFPSGKVVKNVSVSVRDARDVGLITGWGRSPEEGNGNPPQDSWLENPMEGGAWRATVHGVTKESDTTEHAHTESKVTDKF